MSLDRRGAEQRQRRAVLVSFPPISPAFIRARDTSLRRGVMIVLRAHVVLETSDNPAAAITEYAHRLNNRVAAGTTPAVQVDLYTPRRAQSDV